MLIDVPNLHAAPRHSSVDTNFNAAACRNIANEVIEQTEQNRVQLDFEARHPGALAVIINAEVDQRRHTTR